MSFGFSPSDIKELLGIVNWLYGSLREEGGSRENFQSLTQVQATLQQTLADASSSAPVLSVSDADRDALLKAANIIAARSNALAARQAKFDKKFSSKKSASWHREVNAKLKWMLDKDGHRLRQKDVLEQGNMFANQLNISGLKTIVQKVDDAASTTEKLHNAHTARVHSDKLELRDFIQTWGQRHNDTTLTTSAGLMQRLDVLAANNQQFRGKLESDMSSLKNVLHGNSGIQRTSTQLQYIHDDIHQQMAAVIYDATAQTRLLNSIRDDVADLSFRMSQSMMQPSARRDGCSTPAMLGSLPWIMAVIGALVVHRHPQSHTMILKASQAGVGDPISCLLVLYILVALYQVLRSNILPRLTHRMSSGADYIFFQDPWGKMIKVPFSIGQHPLIMDGFVRAYFQGHTIPVLGNPPKDAYFWFTGPSEDSIVTTKNWLRRVRPGVILSISLDPPYRSGGTECPHCGFLFEEIPFEYHKLR
ncbi:hypothetical protein DV736_g937, partial [Chaetothyriales sp. CBS 134916]